MLHANGNFQRTPQNESQIKVGSVLYFMVMLINNNVVSAVCCVENQSIVVVVSAVCCVENQSIVVIVLRYW